MNACPKCGSRATKIASAAYDTDECQICGSVFAASSSILRSREQFNALPNWAKNDIINCYARVLEYREKLADAVREKDALGESCWKACLLETEPLISDTFQFAIFDRCQLLEREIVNLIVACEVALEMARNDIQVGEGVEIIYTALQSAKARNNYSPRTLVAERTP